MTKKKTKKKHCQVALILRSWVESYMIRSISSQFLALGGGEGVYSAKLYMGRLPNSRGPSSRPFIVHFFYQNCILFIYWPMRIFAEIFLPKKTVVSNIMTTPQNPLIDNLRSQYQRNTRWAFARKTRYLHTRNTRKEIWYLHAAMKCPLCTYEILESGPPF